MANATPPEPAVAPARTSASDARSSAAALIALGGVTILGLGMALVFIGLVVPSIFRPGTLLIGLGMLVAAAGGVLAVVRPA